MSIEKDLRELVKRFDEKAEVHSANAKKIRKSDDSSFQSGSASGLSTASLMLLQFIGEHFRTQPTESVINAND